MNNLESVSKGYTFIITTSGALQVKDKVSGLILVDAIDAGQYSFVCISDEVEVIATSELEYNLTRSFNGAFINKAVNGGIETEGYVTYKEIGFDEVAKLPIFEVEVHNGEKFVNQKIDLGLKYFGGIGVYPKPINLPNLVNTRDLLAYSPTFNQTINLPSVVDCSNLFYRMDVFNQPVNLPNAVECPQMLRGSVKFNQPVILPNAVNCWNMIGGTGIQWGPTVFNQFVYIPKAKDCSGLLNRASCFNQPIELPSATDCRDAFRETALTAENINFILRSLPDRTGLTEVALITFTGSPGASTCDASIGTAKNWTVQV